MRKKEFKPIKVNNELFVVNEYETVKNFDRPLGTTKWQGKAKCDNPFSRQSVIMIDTVS